MWLADTSIKRPVTATMFLMALVVLGIVSYPSIGVDLYPKVDFPIVNVTTRLIGASPEIMDIDVTDKIEESINTINGVKTISSQSVEGVSVVTVEFELEKNIDLAVQDVREKISIIRSKLPTDIEEPIIQKVDPDATPVLWLSLSGSRSIGELSTYADEVLQEKLQKVTGVGAVNVTGIRLRQVRIWLSRDKLQAYQITSSDVAQALARENVEIPGGRIESLSKEYSIKVKGEFPRVSDFNDLIVAYSKGAPVRIRDIGRAEDGLEERRSIARLNGETAVGLGIQKQSGTNTVEVVDLVKKELAKVQKTLPPGMNLSISFDQSRFIKTSINEVQHHLIIGGLLAVFAVFLFLKNVRTTLISALALPISVIATFTLIQAFGFTHREHLPEYRAGDETPGSGILCHGRDRARCHGDNDGHRGHFSPRGVHEGDHRAILPAVCPHRCLCRSRVAHHFLHPDTHDVLPLSEAPRAGDSRSPIEASAHGLSTDAEDG